MTPPRATVLSLAALGMLSIAFGPLPSQAQDHPGKADYEDRCARCHTVSEALAYTRPYPDAEARIAYLDRVLARHFARDDDQRARIIAFMEAARAESGK